jgi:hypothetical protein
MMKHSIFTTIVFTISAALFAPVSNAQNAPLQITNANHTSTGMTLHWTSAGTNTAFTIQTRG